jgi:hypothetical protein
MLLCVYFHLLECHDDCCGCGGVGGGGGFIQHHDDALQLLVDSSNMMPSFSVELKKRLLRLFLGPLLYKSLILERLIILGECEHTNSMGAMFSRAFWFGIMRNKQVSRSLTSKATPSNLIALEQRFIPQQIWRQFILQS